MVHDIFCNFQPVISGDEMVLATQFSLQLPFGFLAQLRLFY